MYQYRDHQIDFTLDHNLRELWHAERTLLDIHNDNPNDVVAFINECSAADLHQFATIHGMPQEVALFKAVLNHPNCDRATALNIFDACAPNYFDKKLARGEGYETLEDVEDQVCFQILCEAHKVLTQRETWRGRFTVNAAQKWRRSPKSSPANLICFKLPEIALRDTPQEPAKSAIIYEYAMIALSFDTWLHKR